MKASKAHVQEKGQALILIALAVAGLLALTALAVDGGHLYAQRRQAQNAADTASFAAAIAIINGTDYNQAALDRAGIDLAGNDNRFPDSLDDPAVNSGEPIDVIVNWPPDPTAPVRYVGDTDYVQVKIDAQVSTFFARLVGVDTLPLHVQAVALAVPEELDEALGENGIVALGDECDAVKIHGGAGGETLSLNLTGGGIFSNSTSGSQPGGCKAVDIMGSAYATTPSIETVGCVDPDDIASGHLIIDPPGPAECGTGSRPYPYPVPDDLVGICDSVAPASKDPVTEIAPPGLYTGDFPPNIAGSRTTHLQSGLYCIDGRFLMGSHDTLDISGPGGVTLVVYNGSGGGDIVRWSAGAQIDLIPQGTGSLAGLLMYVPYADQSLCSIYPGSDDSPPCRTVSLVGNADSNWSGTIFAPDSLCKIEGDNTTVAIDAQAICYMVDIGGGGNWTLQYTGGSGYPFTTPPRTELNR